MNHVRTVVATFCLALASAFDASAAAGDANVDQTMDLLPAQLPPNTHKRLDLNLPAADKSSANAKTDTGSALSLHCRQLRTEIDRAQYAAPEPLRDTFTEGPPRDGRARPLNPASTPGLQVNALNSMGRPSGNIEYGRRGKLEEQFLRECQ